MTTHELAQALRNLPDVPIVVEGWTSAKIVAVMTAYDPEGTAILVNGEYHQVTTIALDRQQAEQEAAGATEE